MKLIFNIILFTVVIFAVVLLFEFVDKQEQKISKINMTNRQLQLENEELNKMIMSLSKNLDSIQRANELQSSMAKHIFDEYKYSVFKLIVLSEKHEDFLSDIEMQDNTDAEDSIPANERSDSSRDTQGRKSSPKVMTGTAFCFLPGGIMFSNFHLFDGEVLQAVIKDINGATYTVDEIIYSNPNLDFCIFSTNHTEAPALPISVEDAHVGDKVYTISNPLDMSFTLSEGIVTGFRMNNTIMQHSIPITHGSSGGPVISQQGKVVGLIFGGLGRANINFAVNMSKILEDIERRLLLGEESDENLFYYDSLSPNIHEFIAREVN